MTQSKNHHNEPDLLTLAEVASVLKVDATTVRRWVKQGIFEVVDLPRVGVRHSYRVHRATLEKLLNPSGESEGTR